MQATVQAVRPYELHGTRYYQLVMMPTEGPGPVQARLSHDMVDGDLAAGDLVDVHAILGVIDRVSRLPAAD